MRRPSSPGVDLTELERDVLRLVAEGRTNAEIADRLGIRFDTAKNHVHSILQKLDVATRDEAAAWWRAHGREVAAARRERGRWGRLAVPAGLWRITSGVAAAAVTVVVLGVAVAALTDDEDEPAEASDATPSATPAASQTPAPTATPGLIRDGLPPDAAGPLVVYMRHNEDDTEEILLYDMARATSDTILTADAAQQLFDAQIMGSTVLMHYADRIEQHGLDGSQGFTYRAPEGRTIYGLDVSPDGTQLAVTAEGEISRAGTSWLTIVDLDTGAVVLEVARHEQEHLAAGGWFFWQPHWRDDGESVAVLGGVHKSGYGPVTVVSLDGSTRSGPSAVFPWPSPDGRLVVSGTSLECSTYYAHQIDVLGLDDGIVRATADHATLGLAPIEWSPDGRWLAVGGWQLPNESEPDGACTWMLGEPELLLVLDAVTGDVERAGTTVQDLRQRWNGASRVSLWCHDTELRGFRSRRSQVLDSGVCNDDPAVDEPVRLLVDGEAVDAARSFTLLGTVEVP